MAARERRSAGKQMHQRRRNAQRRSCGLVLERDAREQRGVVLQRRRRRRRRGEKWGHERAHRERHSTSIRRPVQRGDGEGARLATGRQRVPANSGRSKQAATRIERIAGATTQMRPHASASHQLSQPARQIDRLLPRAATKSPFRVARCCRARMLCWRPACGMPDIPIGDACAYSAGRSQSFRRDSPPLFPVSAPHTNVDDINACQPDGAAGLRESFHTGHRSIAGTACFRRPHVRRDNSQLLSRMPPTRQCAAVAHAHVIVVRCGSFLPS